VAFLAADKEPTAEVDASGYPDKGTLRANQNREQNRLLDPRSARIAPIAA